MFTLEMILKGQKEYLYSVIYTTHSRKGKALRHWSHSFTCKLHHAYLSFASLHQMSTGVSSKTPSRLRSFTPSAEHYIWCTPGLFRLRTVCCSYLEWISVSLIERSIFVSALLNVVFVANYNKQRQLQMMLTYLFCKMANPRHCTRSLVPPIKSCNREIICTTLSH